MFSNRCYCEKVERNSTFPLGSAALPANNIYPFRKKTLNFEHYVTT